MLFTSSHMIFGTKRSVSYMLKRKYPKGPQVKMQSTPVCRLYLNAYPYDFT